MSWSDFTSDSVTAVLAEHGVSVTYTAPGGATSSLTALFSETTGDGETDEYSERYERKAYIDLPVATAIDPRGTFTVASEVWQIKGPAGKDADIQSWRLGRTTIQSKRMTQGRR